MNAPIKKHKSLGLWMLTALVVGNMVGSGVFLLPASLAGIGSITIFSWVATAIGALFLALVFSQLSMRYPITGGPYTFCRKGFGDFIGFTVAYNYWIYIWVGNAAISTAFTGYLSYFWPALNTDPLLGFIVTASIVWIFTIVNIVGVHFAGILQLILTILKFLPLAFIALVGLFYIKGSNLAEFNLTGRSDFSALSGGAMLTLWAFLGLESASVPADDVENPERNIPLATILGTLATAIVYIVSTIAILGVIPASILKDSAAPFTDFAKAILGPWGGVMMAIVAIIACIGALNGWILLQGQIAFAAARDDLFPSRFAKLSKSRSPTFAIITSSILITLILILNFQKNLVDKFTFIISLATLAAIIAYLYTTIAHVVLSLRDHEKLSKKKIIQHTIIAALGFVYAFWATANAGEDVVFYGALLFFSSLPFFAWMKWNKFIGGEREAHL